VSYVWGCCIVSIETYGNYQLIKRLAMGGMAQIYLARQQGPEGFEKLLVVKRILPHLAENEEFVRMFLDEARIAARLNHPNIVQIFNLGAQDDSFFIAMEYIHGDDLRKVFKRAERMGQEMPVPLVCRVITEACAGLDYAHKKTDPNGKPLGIVHRDISPQNILLTFEGRVKIVDFGIAKAADQATVTRSGVLKGKYSYMSPEQAAAQRLDGRSDIFALGIIFYELLTGTRLFKRSTDMATLQAVSDCQVTPPSQVNPKLPADLDPIVMKALARKPEDRYGEALQLQLALEDWLVSHQLPSSSAHLAAFMQELYAERLAEEARLGEVLVEDDSMAPPPSRKAETHVEPRRSAPPLPPRSSEDDAGAMTEPLAMADLVGMGMAGRPPKRPSTRTPRPSEGRGGSEREGRVSSERKSLESRRSPESRKLESVSEPRGTSDRSGRQSRGRQPTPPPAPARKKGRGVVVGLLAVLAGLGLSLGGWWLLQPAAAVAPPQAPVKRASVKLVTEPPGAAVVFEGKSLPGATPLTLPAVPAGRYPVVVLLDGYQELQTTVEIPATGTVTLEPLRLVPRAVPPPPVEPRPATVRVTLETEPAHVELVVDGQARGKAPVELEAKAGQELSVRADAPNYRSLTRKVQVKDAPTQVERLVLEAQAVPPPVVERPKPPQVKERPKPPPETTRPVVETESAESRLGTVRFTVTPLTVWAEVSCNGRVLGSTPFRDVKLPAGMYDCKFSNPELGTRTQRVEVKPNVHNKVVVKF